MRRRADRQIVSVNPQDQHGHQDAECERQDAEKGCRKPGWVDVVAARGQKLQCWGRWCSGCVASRSKRDRSAVCGPVALGEQVVAAVPGCRRNRHRRLGQVMSAACQRGSNVGRCGGGWSVAAIRCCRWSLRMELAKEQAARLAGLAPSKASDLDASAQGSWAGGSYTRRVIAISGGRPSFPLPRNWQ